MAIRLVGVLALCAWLTAALAQTTVTPPQPAVNLPSSEAWKEKAVVQPSLIVLTQATDTRNCGQKHHDWVSLPNGGRHAKVECRTSSGYHFCRRATCEVGMKASCWCKSDGMAECNCTR